MAPYFPDPNEKKVRIALFTVMEFCVDTYLEVIGKRDDSELAVILTCPGPKSRRSDAYIEVAQSLETKGHHNIDVIISNKKSKWANIIAAYEVDLILCAGFPWLLPSSLLSDTRFKLGAINLHNADLPKMRGPNAFGWAIVNGEKELTFVTHRMEATVDTGAIIAKRNFPFDVNDTVEECIQGAFQTMCQLVDETIAKALARDPGVPQQGLPTEAPFFEKHFRWIDFSARALDVHNKVRAYYGVRDIPQGAWAKIEGETIRINRTKYQHEGMSRVMGQSAGTIIRRKDDGTFVVQCGDVCLEVLEWEIPPEEEKLFAESCYEDALFESGSKGKIGQFGHLGNRLSFGNPKIPFESSFLTEQAFLGREEQR